MDTEKINEKYGFYIDILYNQLEMISYWIVDIVNHYINEADEKEIDKIFGTLENDPIFNKLRKGINYI